MEDRWNGLESEGQTWQSLKGKTVRAGTCVKDQSKDLFISWRELGGDGKGQNVFLGWGHRSSFGGSNIGEEGRWRGSIDGWEAQVQEPAEGPAWIGCLSPPLRREKSRWLAYMGWRTGRAQRREKKVPRWGSCPGLVSSVEEGRKAIGREQRGRVWTGGWGRDKICLILRSGRGSQPKSRMKMNEQGRVPQCAGKVDSRQGNLYHVIFKSEEWRGGL